LLWSAELEFVPLLPDHLPQAVRGQEVSVEGPSPTALRAHLIGRQEVTESHFLADVPEHGLFDSPCGPLVTAAFRLF